MAARVLIFESHPVQYKAPIYQRLQTLMPGRFEVIYATDVTVKQGNIDQEFGQEVAWDTPLLAGYPYRVLHNERGTPLTGRSSLTSRGVWRILRAERPAAVMLTQSRYFFDLGAYFFALLNRIPLVIRQETQDEMFPRAPASLRTRLRSMLYCLYYSGATAFLYFGELNRQHLIRHGADEARMKFAGFSVVDPFNDCTVAQLLRRRQDARAVWRIEDGRFVLAFFGKFVPKKNPELLFDALPLIDTSLRARIVLLFVGSGELESVLREKAHAASVQFGVASIFAGFVNQRGLPDLYLAADAVALPSRRSGEAWGLVINEALQAGCAVVMSDAVGCAPEFAGLERASVFQEADPHDLALSVNRVSGFERDFYWARTAMRRYSNDAAAEAYRDVLSPFADRVTG